MSEKDNNYIVWDLSPLAKRDDDGVLTQARQRSQQAVQDFTQKWQGRQDYLENSATLKQALDDYEQLMRMHGLNSQEWYYLHLRTSQNQLDTTLKGLAAAADEVAIENGNRIQFFTLQLSQIPQATQRLHLKSAKLKPYHHFLSRLFAEGIYALSEPEEKLLNLVSPSSHDAWIRMTSTFLAQEKKRIVLDDGSVATKTLPELLSLSSSQHKRVRDAAAGHIHRIMARQAPIATEEINAILGYKKTVDKLRGFNRPDQARHMADDIDSEVVDTMLQSVEARFDIAHRFYALKAKLLDVPQLAYHERNVEYGQINQQYSYDQAIAVVKEVFQNLDPQFAEILHNLSSNGQIDVYPRPGKVGGAFCAHALITQPTYVLLNHTNRLQDVLTLAHEMGHAINNELMREKQHALTFDTPLATAEVASTFMEDFVLEHVAQQADVHGQLAINMMKLNDDISSIFRQVAAYRFEQQLHQQYRATNYLSQQEIGALFTHHMSAYMGPAVAQSPGSQNWWVYWSHFRNFFYVYSYASGLLISKSLQSMVRKDATFIKQVKTFLGAGTSAPPADIFAALQINIHQQEFWQAGLESIDQLLKQSEDLSAQITSSKSET